ncbi:MAG: Ltp family lipoprotein [Acidimicrobiales bacterium]
MVRSDGAATSPPVSIDPGSDGQTADDIPATLPMSEATTTSPPESDLTPAQQNAVRSAQSYVGFSGFSRQGLIDQLASDYGDQYSIEDATIAVDSLNIDWKAEAIESAQSYLEHSGFSRQGLIDQLSSQYGDQFTVEQATTAVDAVNADWNAEAVEAAQSYLEHASFSCQGLIDQLSSEFGDQFTSEQASFGAASTGIC